MGDSTAVPREDDDLRGLRELSFSDLIDPPVDFPDAWMIPRVLFYSPVPPVVLGDCDPGVNLSGHLSGLAGGDRVNTAGQRNQEDVNLAQHLELGGSQMVAKVAEMGDADLIHAKDEDGVFAPLEPLALVVVGRDRIDRNITDAHVDGPPILSSRREPFKDHRTSPGHPDVAVGPMLVAGRYDVLREVWPRQIAPAVGICQDAGPFGRGNLKSRVTEPLDQDGARLAGRYHSSEDVSLNNLDLMTKAQANPWK